MALVYLLVICFTVGTYGSTTVNVSPGIYSVKSESDGLQLPITYTFKPITALTARVHISRKAAVFVHYQLAIQNNGYEFWSKLQIRKNHDEALLNAGAVVHVSSLTYTVPTGYWMDNLDAGYYTFEIYYKSSGTISVSSSTDWQTAVLQVMWFEGGYAVNDGIKCDPQPNPLFTYNVLGPIRNLETEISSLGRVVIAAYQMSIYSTSNQWFVTRMHVNNQQKPSTSMISGCGTYLNNHGLWMESLSRGKYYFGVSYRNNYNSYFEDCQNNYEGNTNLFTMRLPTRCYRKIVRPTSSLSISRGAWRNSDLSYGRSLSYSFQHVFVRYQFATAGYNSYTRTRLLINNVVQKHTMSIHGNAEYANNAGFWQGSLPSGSHTFTVQYYTGTSYTHSLRNDQYARGMDIVVCY